METIVIAGGTGLIGSKLVAFWKKQGHEVRCLTRKETNQSKGLFHWDPIQNQLDTSALENATVIVNLSGAGIADKRWSELRKKELIDSRVDTTKCLWNHAKELPLLKQYISASGIICYGFDQPEKNFVESDPFGKDTLSYITELWENAADMFQSKCTVTKLRISVVLAKEGGALKPIAAPIKWGFGAALGTGKQAIPWIHIDDLVRLFNFSLHNQYNGALNSNAGNTTNLELTKAVAKAVKKPLWLPKVPGWALRLVLGEMASVVLDGLKADNSKIRELGYQFHFPTLEAALDDIYKKNG